MRAIRTWCQQLEIQGVADQPRDGSGAKRLSPAHRVKELRRRRAEQGPRAWRGIERRREKQGPHAWRGDATPEAERPATLDASMSGKRFGAGDPEGGCRSSNDTL